MGRLPHGFTLGVLNATTQREATRGDTTYEPASNYAVARVQEELRNGNSSFGAIVTAVNRAQDKWSSPYLSSNAYVGAVDFRHRFLSNR